MTGGFAQFSDRDDNIASRPVPRGAAGCYVTLVGPGSDEAAGATIGPSFIPVRRLGPTYTVTTATLPGTPSLFASGRILLVANGAHGATGGTAIEIGICGLRLSDGTPGTGGQPGSTLVEWV